MNEVVEIEIPDLQTKWKNVKKSTLVIAKKKKQQDVYGTLESKVDSNLETDLKNFLKIYKNYATMKTKKKDLDKTIQKAELIIKEYKKSGTLDKLILNNITTGLSDIQTEIDTLYQRP